MSFPPYQGGYPQGPGYPQPGGMPQPAPAPVGLPYAAQPYPNATGYPPGGTYPQGGTYPPQGGYPMQGGMTMTGQSTYPPEAGYPSASPYPTAGAPYPTAGAPYPTAGAPYPTAGAPYPTAGATYPSSGDSASAPYPSGNAPPGNAPPGNAPPGNVSYPPAAYPSSGESANAPYPSGNSSSGNASYPPAAYPSSSMPGKAPYPHSSESTNYLPSNQPNNAPNSTTSASTAAPYPSTPTSSHTPLTSIKTSTSESSSHSASSRGTDANSTLYYECAKKPGDSGSVKPLMTGFNPEADATQIKNCLKSASLNETVIVNILPHRSNAQRQKIRLMYKTMYGQDLLQVLRSRLSGDFESVTVALLMTPAEYDAYLINKAIQGAGTDEDVLVEILCTRTNTQMREIGSQYRETYKASIEQHMKGDTSGHFMRLLISLSNGARQEDQGVNVQKAEEDAKKLYKAGAGRLGTDESSFNSVFVSQSFEQLRAVFSAYQRQYKKDMEKVIKSEMSGDLERGMKAIVRFTLDKHSYFANVLYKAMKGIGTDEKSLIRTLVSRSEIDLEQVTRAFSNIKGESKPLIHWIKKETSGPFRDMLTHIIGAAH